MASIIARAGSATASIKPNRPSWADMNKNYMGESVPRSELYPMISKQLVKLHQENERAWENTCAIRMSYALNRSGVRLPPETSPKGGTIKGDDAFYYWIRVKDLKKYLKDRFHEGDFEHKFQAIKTKDEMQTRALAVRDSFIKKIYGKRGIIVFDVEGWDGATGHFTLWDGTNLSYAGNGYHNDATTTEYYFWFARFDELGNAAVQTAKITFWELK